MFGPVEGPCSMRAKGGSRPLEAGVIGSFTWIVAQMAPLGGRRGQVVALLPRVSREDD